ncbi:MAG: hypothetical protein LBP88_07590 [Treponema sp.]|nr:hypothetical protein [Treponema sp.]
MKEQKPIIREFAVRYGVVQTKPEKSRMLTDFTNRTGFNQKYAIGILTSEGKTELLHLNRKLLKAQSIHKTRKKRVSKKRSVLDTAA